MMTWHRALLDKDLAENSFTHQVLDGRDVLISRNTGVIAAVSNVCPHNGVLLSEGVMKDGCISCPGHFWRFNLTTGKKQGDDKTSLAIYPTRISDAWIEVQLPELLPQRSMREILLASARGDDVRNEVAR